MGINENRRQSMKINDNQSVAKIGLQRLHCIDCAAKIALQILHCKDCVASVALQRLHCKECIAKYARASNMTNSFECCQKVSRIATQRLYRNKVWGQRAGIIFRIFLENVDRICDFSKFVGCTSTLEYQSPSPDLQIYGFHFQLCPIFGTFGILGTFSRF